ncbi:CACTA en-spm transposon protein [Cucumis melo var. makuwa]|uniref:CACTA en-spm transposon protein n=1 Tax=Cucumis melo var. makuwa TaxID=1194695 RepID=A0A5D3CDL8_CUCMM|nr:CACTA en-spm transposon protein [Cucumis melo var. makuwa]
MSTGTMSQFPIDFNESKGLFDFNVEDFNTISSTSSIGDTSVRFLKWVDVTVEYIELVKRAFTQFIEHQMLSVWKEFRGLNHRHFKNFDDPE